MNQKQKLPKRKSCGPLVPKEDRTLDFRMSQYDTTKLVKGNTVYKYDALSDCARRTDNFQTFKSVKCFYCKYVFLTNQ